MGVTGLWRLIEPAGKPVPVETLENKVLAVDISIWLHQVVKGYQDAKGAPLPNAHLMGLFQRLCKLLYFRIKPVFVFDGAFPELKRETIAKRQDHKAKYNSESERLKRELALILSKKTALNSLLGKQISPKKSSTLPQNNDDIFKLPALPQQDDESESESEDEQNSSGSIIDLHSVDIESENFKKLDVKEKYDLLVELKETRKMNSWGKLHELPKKSDSFSDFQMQRLLKRRKVQECLEETEKEMGDSGMSLIELESLLNDTGIDTRIESLPTRRIASNVSTRFLLIKDMKQALSDAKKRDQTEEPSTSQDDKNIEIDGNKIETKPQIQKVDELEDDLQKAIKMSLECVDEANTSAVSKTDDSWTSCLTDSDYSDDSEEYDGFEEPDDMSSAKAYIMQYSDFTHRAVDELVTRSSKIKNKPKVAKIDEILEDINKEKSIIVDNVDVSSDDDDFIQEATTSKTNDEKDNSFSPNYDENTTTDCTQTSVICIENPMPEIISLDSSTEEAGINREVVIKEEHQESSESELEEVSQLDNRNSSDSSDSDFEEVPDIEDGNLKKPVVELTLNMGDAPEDDIFADIFEERKITLANNKIHEKETIIEKDKMPEKTFLIAKKVNVKGTYEEKTELDNNKPGVFKKPLPVIEKPVVCSSRDENKSQESSTNQAIESQNTIKTIPNTSNSTQTNSVESKQSTQDLVKVTETIVNAPKEAPIHTTEELNSMVEELQNEERELQQEKGRLDRVGRNITEQMTKEAQELLQIFGIPYIVAPMEAEAQCAFLENVKLTDGTITDDSDIWLFGGRTVYKNFFNQKKHVLQFLAERIETSFNLSREQLILLALLVGSDYTTGLTGVGPVTALEILASFPINKKQFLNETSKPEKYAQIVKGLQEFKQWVRAGKRTDNTSLKKKLKNVNVAEDFPSVRVVQAYLEPNIEKSEDKFTWGELDITVLRDYTKAKFGWSQNKLDEIMKPVLKRIQDRKTQRTVHDFFKRKIEFQSLEDQMSKRVKAAVSKMGPELSPNDLVDEAEKIPKPPTKRKANKTSDSIQSKPGTSGAKLKKTEESVLKNQGVRVVSEMKDGKSEIDIKITKTDRYQEIIPQRQKDQKNLLENKLKAIELFRKTKIDQKRKTFKRKPLQPKEKADLSESDSD